MAFMPEVVAISIMGFGRASRVAKWACHGKVSSERLDALEGEHLGSFDAVKNFCSPDLDPLCNVPRCGVAYVDSKFVFGAAYKEVMVGCKDDLLLGVEEPKFIRDFLVTCSGLGGGIMSVDNLVSCFPHGEEDFPGHCNHTSDPENSGGVGVEDTVVLEVIVLEKSPVEGKATSE
jgi:hypothetical protein